MLSAEGVFQTEGGRDAPVVRNPGLGTTGWLARFSGVTGATGQIPQTLSGQLYECRRA